MSKQKHVSVIIHCSTCYERIYPALMTKSDKGLFIKATCHSCGLVYIANMGDPYFFPWKVFDSEEFEKRFDK